MGTALADYLYYRVGYIMPTQQIKITVHITNRSPNTFVYKNNGMTLGTVSVEVEETTGFTGYDGNKIELKKISGIPYTHPAIKALLNNDGTTKNLSQVLTLYDLLEEKGYTGTQALSDYFLDYYKTKYADSTLTWEALLSDSHRNDVIADCSLSGVDNIFSVSESDKTMANNSALKDYVYSLGGGSHIQIKWPEEKLATMSYDIFYQDLLSVVFNSESVDFRTGARDHGVGDYLDKNAEPYISANAYLASIGNKGELASSESGEFQMTVTLEGEGTGNAYAYYDFGGLFNLTLQFIPATTDIVVSKEWDDANNKDGSRPDSVTVQLYANGDKSGEPVILDNNSDWKHTFNVPVYSRGEEITYTVEEAAVNGYTATVTGNAADGFVITNSHEPENIVDVLIDVPETGDPSHMMLWLALACLSLCGMAVVLQRTRKEN